MVDWQETVRDTMKRRGMTRTQLARELGVNVTTVGRWLSRRSDPAASVLRHIGTILGLSLVRIDPADCERREENELIEAFRRMTAAERGLLLQYLRERDPGRHGGLHDDEDRATG